MKQQKFSLRRRQVMALGAGSLAAPAAVAVQRPTGPVVNFAGGKIVVSGRILGAPDGLPLAGAQVEIWQADARGVRADHTREIAVTDGDGRYFSSIYGSGAHHLHYRVSHRGYTARVTQMHAADARQRSVTMTRDDEGAMRAAFEMTLAPCNVLASGTPDYVAL